MTNNWPINEPDSLEDLCVQACVKNIETLAVKTSDKRYDLKPGVGIPIPSICDKLFQQFVDSSSTFSTEWTWLGIFSDIERTRLCKVELLRTVAHEEQATELLEVLLNHPLKQLDLINTSLIGNFSGHFSSLNATKSLLSLRVEGENVANILSMLMKTQTGKDSGDFKDPYLSQLQRLILTTNIMGQPISDITPYYFLTGIFRHLTHLDVCRWRIDHYSFFDELSHCKKLQWLNLSCVVFPSHEVFINGICKIKTLRHLDISSNENVIMSKSYQYPDKVLQSLVHSLPELISLDISATNLAGQNMTTKSFRPGAKGVSDSPDDDHEPCSIPGLEGRQFEFLGLYNCPYESYRRLNIPAKQVTGNKNEEQLLCALRRYNDRKEEVNDVLNQLFVLFKEETVHNQHMAFEGILQAMKRHKDDRHVQISSSASLFYIMKGEQKSHITQKQRRRLVIALLDGIEDPWSENVMIRNCCLTLCHLSMPQDVIFCYERMIGALLRLNHAEGQDEFIQRITLYMINHLACQVDGEEKKIVGDLGAIEIMLDTIEEKLQNNECDEIMEMAWSTMWNVTDETAINCDRFMDRNGMQLFIKCLQVFPDKPELLRNMMGLMGNIAEVPHLRPRLMEKNFIEIFCDLLDSNKDGIEVSYNSAGVFSHMMADGTESWTVDVPSRDYVTNKLVANIQRWPLESSRNINYRSFGPILRLVDSYHAFGAQYWAVWALCNLTTVYPEKYCALLKKEGGEEQIQNLLSNSQTDTKIKDLCVKILENLKTKPEEMDNGSSEESDENQD